MVTDKRTLFLQKWYFPHTQICFCTCIINILYLLLTSFTSTPVFALLKYPNIRQTGKYTAVCSCMSGPTAFYWWWHSSQARFSVSNPHIWPWWGLPTSQGSPLPPSLTVAWKNNCTWKTIKTILPEFLTMDSQLLASFHSPRCGENMTCRKIVKSLLFIGAKECVFN